MTSIGPIDALVFDAYGTLFDVHSVAAACEAAFPGNGAALSATWRVKQLEYSWLTSLMGRYEDFWALTGRALSYALRSLDLPAGGAAHARLLDAYLRLDLYPEAREALAALAPRPLAILSNGAPTMLQAAIENAGIAPLFRHILSVDELRVFKPDQRVYRMAAERLGLAPERVGFVSSNGWDIAGATHFGFRTFWINRAGLPAEELGLPPAATLRQLSEIVPLLAHD